jgi:hypothetical protein
MKKPQLHNRRHFLKIVAAGTVGITFLSKSIAAASSFLSSSATGWRSGLKINPAIDNVKAICCYDDAMVVNKVAGDFARQNEGVNRTLIEANIDEMAKKLTNLSVAATAWQTIFRKPTNKQLTQVKAAIKVQCANTLNMPRVAIVGKICTELINVGVLPGNITIYDSYGNAGGTGKYADSLGNPIAGLPSGVIVSNKTLDGPTVPVGTASMQCSSIIAQENTDHSISYIADILVNIATNRGNDSTGSELGLCMDNHVGTLKYATPSADELIDMNQCEAIIGQGTAEIPCRQQLCIVDSLWASVTPTGSFSHVPCRIVMGMLAPVVDYLTAENIRKPSSRGLMNTPYNTSVTANWLTRFGYISSDLQWNEFSPSTGISLHHESGAAQTLINVSLAPSGGKASARFMMPRVNAPASINLFNLNGRLMRRLSLAPSTTRSISVSWDRFGARLPAGRYAVQCIMGGNEKTAIAEVVR